MDPILVCDNAWLGCPSSGFELDGANRYKTWMSIILERPSKGSKGDKVYAFWLLFHVLYNPVLCILIIWIFRVFQLYLSQLPHFICQQNF